MSQRTNFSIAALIFGATGLFAMLYVVDSYALRRHADYAPRSRSHEQASAADFRRYAERLAHLYNHPRPGEELDEDEETANAIATVAAEGHLSTTELVEGLSNFAARVRSDPHASHYDRALADFAESHFPEAADHFQHAAEEYHTQRAQRLTEADHFRDEERQSLLLAGNAQLAAVQYAEAEKTFRVACELVPEGDTGAWIETHERLAETLYELGRYPESLDLFQQVLAETESRVGPDDPDTIERLGWVAFLLQALGRFAEAEPILVRTVAFEEKRLGPEHPDLAPELNNLAQVYQNTDRLDDAEPLFRRALAINEKTLPGDSTQLAGSFHNLARLLQMKGRLDEALPLAQRALAIGEKGLATGDPMHAVLLDSLGGIELDQGRLADAEARMLRALEIRRAALGDRHPDLVGSYYYLAKLRWAQDRHAESRTLAEEGLALARETLGAQTPRLRRIEKFLADHPAP